MRLLDFPDWLAQLALIVTLDFIWLGGGLLLLSLLSLASLGYLWWRNRLSVSAGLLSSFALLLVPFLTGFLFWLSGLPKA